MNRVAVLGGGPAGLYAALRLARRGIAVSLIEREPVPGGLAAGLDVAGMSVDHGSHRLHPSVDPDILADLRVLMGDELQERRRNGRIRLVGRWLSFPLAPGEVGTRLPPSVAARLAMGAVGAMGRRTDSTTFASVVDTGLGRPMGELFYFPYARKIWGVPPHQISGEQARRRISADSPWKLVRKAFTSSSGRTFFYPAGGFGRIPAALAAAARDAGAELVLGTSVIGLSPDGEGWAVETEGGEQICAELVLSTIPMTLLARLLHPPAVVADALDGLRSRAMVLVYLTVPTSRWTRFDAHYFPEAHVPFTRISEPRNYRDSSLDPPDRTVLCVEIPCDVGDRVWSMPDDDLRSLIRSSILGEDLPDPGREGRVRRLTHAYPIYDLPAGAAIERVDEWLSGLDGVVTFGRQGLFAHDNTHHALAMAGDAADGVTVSEGSLAFDHDRWSAARARFASHVVED